MRKLALVLLCLSFAAVAVIGQTRTRTAPSMKGDTGTKKSNPAIRNRTGATEPTPDGPPPPAAKVIGDRSDEEILIDTNLVTTPVSVLDRNGRFVPGLKKTHFKIFEDGIPQKVTYFQSEEQPFTVILMIDISPSTRYNIDEIRYAAVTFVNQLRPADKVMVVNFDRQIRVMTEPTNDKQTLFTAIYKSQFGSGTSLYEAVDTAINLDFVKTPGRKAIVLFTDGVDTTSRGATIESTIAGVEEVDALIYPVRYDTETRGGGPTGGRQGAQIAALRDLNLPPNVIAQLTRGNSSGEYERGKAYLNVLAESSGGRMFEAAQLGNLEDTFKGVAEELRRQYAVGYYPSDTGKPGDRKKIKIQVIGKPGAIIRSKTTYVIKGEPGPAAAASDSME